MKRPVSELVTRSGILIQIRAQCPNYTRRCTEVHSTLWSAVNSVRANRRMLLRAICANSCVQIVQFVQTVPCNLPHSSLRPATGNQPKIDIDPPPHVSPQVETPPSQDTCGGEIFKSPAKRENSIVMEHSPSNYVQSLSTYQIHKNCCILCEIITTKSILKQMLAKWVDHCNAWLWARNKIWFDFLSVLKSLDEPNWLWGTK